MLRLMWQFHRTRKKLHLVTRNIAQLTKISIESRITHQQLHEKRHHTQKRHEKLGPAVSSPAAQT